MGIGDWGLGIGDWAQSPFPIPNPQSPLFFQKKIFKIKSVNKNNINIIKYNNIIN